ncbi:putative cAMP receptor [Mollisia scopiformis]|uniref:Putative cAMP receptor n=1 Tax=Mollisia scopiformis TaxID=149040 RepID=A0A194XVY3_MOLSC|nr:putative cAMP receptor [Mollisia scopiformis]KUJ23877.1 putative cAMP receptor [Mollisia scopiformis]
MTLSAEQLHVLAIVERSASVLSILGIFTIIGTFCFSRQFRNPIHRIIFINAFYNLFDVTATTISLSGPRAGNHSALCQFQGFLLQMFPLADVLWTLAMACDVFLIVFYKYETEDLRRLELKYAVGITTVVFIPALTFLFIHTPEKGPIYGSVTLWCAISPKWVLFRIIFYYGPIWLIIFITFILYGLVGIEIIKQRRMLESISNDYLDLDTMGSAADTLHSPETIDAEMAMAAKEARGSISITNSVPHMSPSDAIALQNTPRSRSRSPVSFRNYILMPLMFFVVLLAIWVAPTTNRVASLVNPGFVSDPLLLAVGATGSLRGFWNGVVFVTLGAKERRRRNTMKNWRG